MKYCNNCGQQNNDENFVCFNCGAQLPEAKKKNTVKIVIIIVSIVLILSLLCCCGIFGLVKLVVGKSSELIEDVQEQISTEVEHQYNERVELAENKNEEKNTEDTTNYSDDNDEPSYHIEYESKLDDGGKVVYDDVETTPEPKEETTGPRYVGFDNYIEVYLDDSWYNFSDPAVVGADYIKQYVNSSISYIITLSKYDNADYLTMATNLRDATLAEGASLISENLTTEDGNDTYVFMFMYPDESMYSGMICQNGTKAVLLSFESTGKADIEDYVDTFGLVLENTKLFK